ncbi:MAG TPA: hypothetical protein VGM44_11190 [Polyangiaceae bacterium]|jgi:hypothetical protein
MSDLSPETSKLLELARDASPLDGARRAQIKSGLLAKIAAGGAVGGAATHLGWSKLGWLSSPLAKGVSALVVLSAIGGGVYLGVRSSAGQRALSSTASQSNSIAEQRGSSTAPQIAQAAINANQPPIGEGNAGNVAPTETEPTSPETTSGRPTSTASATNPKPSTNTSRVAAASPDATRSAPDDTKTPSSGQNADTLAEETKLLRDADQALRAGDAQRALSLLEEDGARFPHGTLEPERAQELMLARCKLGQVDLKTAQNYLVSHANSAFAARLKDACGVR